MDECNLEPGDGLRSPLPWVRPLLRAPLCGAIPRRSGSSVRTRLRCKAVVKPAWLATYLEDAATDLRQQHVRPVPRCGARRLHSRRIRRNGAGVVAHIPGAHEAA